MEQKTVRYRDEALNTISSPEQLDQLTKVIRVPGWIITSTLMFALIAAVVWLFFGNISDGIKVKGIIFPQLGVTDINSRTYGNVTSVLAKEGDYVDAGQIIAIIPDNAVISDIEKIRLDIASIYKGSKSDLNENELNEQLADLIAEYELNSVIKSKVSGIIQSIVSKNATVSDGTKIAAVIIEDKYTNDKELIAYVPLTSAQSIKVGMEAQISPIFAPREEYGYMKGYITKVGNVPVTQDMLQKTFGDWEQPKSMLDKDGCVEVRITMSIDPDSPNNFQWSNKKGRSLNVDISTICNVLIVSKDKRPIDLLLGL